MSRTIVVFTYRHLRELTIEGGSQAWALNADNARRCTYIICTRNRWHEGSGDEPHGAAFLIGKISSVEPAPERNDRFIVRFSEYAIPEGMPIVWPGSRNPVAYYDDPSELGIRVDGLVWRPVAERLDDVEIEGDDETENDVDRGLSFAEARSGLATRYGVPANKIDITFRG